MTQISEKTNDTNKHHSMYQCLCNDFIIFFKVKTNNFHIQKSYVVYVAITKAIILIGYLIMISIVICSLNQHLNVSNSLPNEKQMQFQVGGTFGEAVVP